MLSNPQQKGESHNYVLTYNSSYKIHLFIPQDKRIFLYKQTDNIIAAKLLLYQK